MEAGRTDTMPRGAVEEFDRIAERLAGVRLSQARRRERAAALADAWRESGAASWSEFRRLLDSEAGRRTALRLAGEFTVKETYFFRAPVQFEALRDLSLPDVAARVGDSEPVRIWSAGCATGEEAYSIAMLADAAPCGHDVAVLGTDIGGTALATARAGRYAPEARDTTPRCHRPLLDSCMCEDGDGLLSVAPAISRRVSFARHNLMADAAPGAFDIIFCRNVMVYVPMVLQPDLIARLDRALRPGGWLFLGDAELLHVMPHGFEAVLLDGGVAYRRASVLPATAMRMVS